MTDMDKLIAAVEAGKLSPPHYQEISALLRCDDNSFCIIAADAYNGSLNAAKRLHDARLPGWEFCLQGSVASVWRWHEGAQSPWDIDTFSGGIEGNPARAWLLAILKAVNAQERKT